MEQNVQRLDQNIQRLQIHMEQDIQGLQRLQILMENDIPKQINLLAEGQALILERLPKPNEVEELSFRVDTLETVARRHTAEITELKKAL
jgi:hypothetical protein